MKWKILFILLLITYSDAYGAGWTRHGDVNNTDSVANQGDGIVGLKALGQIMGYLLLGAELQRQATKK